MTKQQAYLTLIDELTPILTFHAGNYNAWRQGNKKALNLGQAIEALIQIREELREEPVANG